MAFSGMIKPKVRAYIKYLKKIHKQKATDVVKECHVSLATVYRIWNEKFHEKNVKCYEKRRRVGRPEKLTLREKRCILRQVKILRKENGNFTSKKLMVRSGVNLKYVSSRTVRRLLNKNGYRYLQARKKGILSHMDIRRRSQFAKKMRRGYDADVWTDKIAFYLDGVSFIHKTNPADEAKAPRGRIWRKKDEGLATGCTAKGAHVGSGGRIVKMMVAISHTAGVVLCEQYQKLDGPHFQSLIHRNFNRMFSEAKKGRSRLWVQDGDPSQNSAAARQAMKSVRAKLLSIPPRSPDINPIENFFHLIKRRLVVDALAQNIQKESFEQFSSRVQFTIMNFEKAVIDKIIDTMDKRMGLIINKKGKQN